MDSTNVLATQGATVMLIPLLVQWMKKCDWALFRWINEESEQVNRAVAWALGIVAAVGIHWAAEWQGARFVLTIDFAQFTVAGLLHESAVVGGQLGGQQVIYRILRIGELLERALKTQAGDRTAFQKEIL